MALVRDALRSRASDGLSCAERVATVTREPKTVCATCTARGFNQRQMQERQNQDLFLIQTLRIIVCRSSDPRSMRSSSGLSAPPGQYNSRISFFSALTSVAPDTGQTLPRGPRRSFHPHTPLFYPHLSTADIRLHPPAPGPWDANSRYLTPPILPDRLQVKGSEYTGNPSPRAARHTSQWLHLPFHHDFPSPFAYCSLPSRPLHVFHIHRNKYLTPLFQNGMISSQSSTTVHCSFRTPSHSSHYPKVVHLTAEGRDLTHLRSYGWCGRSP